MFGSKCGVYKREDVDIMECQMSIPYIVMTLKQRGLKNITEENILTILDNIPVTSMIFDGIEKIYNNQGNKESSKGCLKEYANPELQQEESDAWAKVAEEKEKVRILFAKEEMLDNE